MKEDGGVVVLGLQDLFRCWSCRRLLTPRHLRAGGCECGTKKVLNCTYIDSETDLHRIEEKYGWDNVRLAIPEVCIGKGLLQGGKRTAMGDGSVTYTLDEARLHSKKSAQARGEQRTLFDSFGRDIRRRISAIPRALRPQKWGGIQEG